MKRRCITSGGEWHARTDHPRSKIGAKVPTACGKLVPGNRRRLSREPSCPACVEALKKWRRSIPLIRDESGEAAERCCFCRKRTAYWTNTPSRTLGDQVAVCPDCARRNWTLEDVPSKSLWMDNEKRIDALLDNVSTDVWRAHCQIERANIPLDITPIPRPLFKLEEGEEACALCWKSTPHKTRIKDRSPVPCCRECASKYHIKDVPTARYYRHLIALLQDLYQTAQAS